MTKLILAALIGAFVLSSIARANNAAKNDTLKTEVAKKNKIEPIRIVPKQDRGIASEDDGFVPLMKPKPQKKIQKAKAPKVLKKPHAK